MAIPAEREIAILCMRAALHEFGKARWALTLTEFEQEIRNLIAINPGNRGFIYSVGEAMVKGAAQQGKSNANR